MTEHTPDWNTLGPELLQWLERCVVCIEAAIQILPGYNPNLYPGTLLTGAKSVVRRAKGTEMDFRQYNAIIAKAKGQSEGGA